MKKPPAKRLSSSFTGLPAPPGKRQFIPYETRLDHDPEWAMSEGSKFFEGKSQVQATLKKIAKRLGELGVSYVVVGGMALFRYGYRRFTDDVDILVTRESLKEIHRKLDGLGYVPPFQGSKNLRDAEYGVKIEFLLAGDYPGDGKPKPVAFPMPDDVVDTLDGIRYISLPSLIELKLASGMTNPERMKDLADVIELVKILSLPLALGDRLNPFVQDRYKQLWKDAQSTAKRYLKLWRGQAHSNEVAPQSVIDEEASAKEFLQAMLADGVTFEPASGESKDYSYLVTTDPIIAKKYDMHDESEFL
jgi:hypothetical protein